MTENGSSGTPQEDDLPGGDEQVAEAGDAGSRRASRGRRKATHAKPRRRRRLKWALGILGLVIVLVVGAVAGVRVVPESQDPPRRGRRVFANAPTKGIDVGTENILMVGSTSRCALTDAEPGLRPLLAGGHRGEQRRRDDPSSRPGRPQSVSILSIPRDLFVPNARTEGANKIDAALYEGPTQLVARDRRGLRDPDPALRGAQLRHVSSTWSNALGGVKMYFPEPVFDAVLGAGHSGRPGCIHLNGFQAFRWCGLATSSTRGPGSPATTRTTWPQEAPE